MSTIEELRSKVKGSVYEQGSEELTTRLEKAAHYQKIYRDLKPALWVVVQDSPSDIQQTLIYAKEHSLHVTILAGGHSRFAIQSGAVVLDLSELRSIQVDPETKQVILGPGANLGEVVDATDKYHFQVPLGVISHTGLGLVLGGGIGWLARQCGVSADSIIGLKAVSGTGELIHVSRNDGSEESGDLLRAFKGAPGVFAVVYEYHLQGYDVVPQPQVINILFSMKADDPNAADNLRKVAEFLEQPHVEAEHRGTLYFVFANPPTEGPICNVLMLFLGSEDEARSFYAPLLNLATAATTITPLGWSSIVRMLDGTLPPACWYMTAFQLWSLSDSVFEKLREIWSVLLEASPMSSIIFEQRGGKARTGIDEFTTYRVLNPIDCLFSVGHPDSTYLESTIIPVARQQKQVILGLEDCKPSSYTNYEPTEGLAAGVVVDHDRLARAKARYDPHNIIRSSPLRL